MLSIARIAAKLLLLAVPLVLLSGCGNGSHGSGDEVSAGLVEPSLPAPEDTSSATATATSSAPAAAPATPTPTPPSPPEHPPPGAPTSLPGCEAVQRESHYCLTTAVGAIGLLGLDSGSLCPLTTTDAPTGTFLAGGSIAVLDEHLYVCGEQGLIRISLHDGSWEVAGRPCNGVGSFDGGLLVNRWLVDILDPASRPSVGPPLTWYPDFEAVRNEAPERTFGLGDSAETMTVQGSKLYTAWHAGISVDVGDLAEDRPLGVLTLEDYDGWMFGMSVTEDGYLVLIGDQGVYVFDAYDGRRLARRDLPTGISGVACTAGRSVTPRDTATPTPTATSLLGAPTATPCSFFGCPDPCADLASDPSPFRLHELPPSIPIEMNCLGGGAGSSNYALAEDLLVPGATEELHVVGVYEARGNPGFRPSAQGVVDVIVHERPKPVVLALSSYEGMLWRIGLDPGARLSRVILQGYGPQEVEGVPEGVPVEHREDYSVCGYAYGWEVWNNGGGGSYELMIKSLRRYTGLVESSFQGCYSGDTFEIPYWSGTPPMRTPTPVPGDETLARETVSFPGCASVTAEAQYCLTTVYGSVALLGLESGNVCPLAATSAGVGNPFVSSIAWRGELLYACTGAGLVRISLRDGSWESSQIACGGVGEYDGGLLLSGSITHPSTSLESPLRAYPDYAAVLNGDFSRAFAVGGGATRFTVAGDTLYGAWHSTDTIDVADLSADEARESILLEGYNGWILGMSVVDGQLVISGDSWGDTVRIFDAQNGRHLRDIQPSTPVFGLSCVVRQAPS